MFEAWGRFVYRQRWVVFLGSFLLLALSIAGLLHGGPLNAQRPAQSPLESDRADQLVAQQVLRQRAQNTAGVLFVARSRTLLVQDPAFRDALEHALAPLSRDSRVGKVETPYNAPAAARAGLVSKDGHEALVDVTINDSSSNAQKYFPALRRQVHSDVLSIHATGELPIDLAFSEVLGADLKRAEYVSLPVTLVLLLLIFAGVVAALLPLGVGLLTIIGGVGGTLFLANATFVSQYALNIVTLIGLGVSIDYSLLIVNRYREELATAATREQALGRTIGTAGRAVTFSGITVAIGLSAMLFYQGSFLASLGAAGAIVVGVAIFYALSFLAALLAIVGNGVNRLKVPFVPQRPQLSRGFWFRLANSVMGRPLVVLVPALALLVLAGTPFLAIRVASGGPDQLPPRVEARQGWDALVKDFPGHDQTTLTAVVDYGGGDPRTEAHRAAVAELQARVGAIKGVLAAGPVQQGTHIAVFDVTSNYAQSSDAARGVVEKIRAEHVRDAQVLVTGQTAADLDIIKYLLARTPVAVGFVVLITLIVLFLMTGSLLLPVKAIVTNFLSIAAAFGALVWIFQEGHLSGQLGFTPQPLDPSVPVILFSIVFGLSMDYEVLLVSRIQEEYRRTGDNRAAVAMGLQRSGRIITGAAGIMVAVFLSFGLADVVIIKGIGIGLAIAIALDATVVRALVVPAVMRLLGNLNWWAPAPLALLYSRFSLHPAAESRSPAPS